MMYIDYGDTIMTFLDYKGQMIKEIARKDLDYLRQFIKLTYDSIKERRAVAQVLYGYDLIGKPIKLAPDKVAECAGFGGECAVSTEYYAARNQPNFAKYSDDHKIGKLAEWVVWQALLPLFPHLTAPDTAIYALNDKSWNSDLIDPVTGLQLAIKAQRAESVRDYNYPMSWTFEKIDPKIFGQNFSNIKCVFVTIDLENNYGRVDAICNLSSLHEKREGRENLFKPPVKAELWSKLTIHYADLVRYNLTCEI